MVQSVSPSPLRQTAVPSRRLARALAVIVLTAVASAAGTGCVYRMVVQQGNFLDTDQVAQLQNGMTRSQVRFLLGTPMLPNAFDNDRWDYLYYLKIGRRGEAEQRRLTVYFTDDKVTRFENIGTAASQVKAETVPAAVAPASGPG
jgi:outer membrane protein assembly factor BamE